MLIEELIGARLVLERGDIDLQNDIEDILLRARKGNIPELGLSDIVGELNKMRPEVYIDPNDEEFRQTLVGVLQQSDWVKHADPSGSVILKKPEEMLPSDEDPGEEVQKAEDIQHAKAQKFAMKNVRDGNR